MLHGIKGSLEVLKGLTELKKKNSVEFKEIHPGAKGLAASHLAF